jgi:hypothetical protein
MALMKMVSLWSYQVKHGLNENSLYLKLSGKTWHICEAIEWSMATLQLLGKTGPPCEPNGQNIASKWLNKLKHGLREAVKYTVSWWIRKLSCIEEVPRFFSFIQLKIISENLNWLQLKLNWELIWGTWPVHF